MERKVIHKVKGQPAIDGAGVHLVRVLGPATVAEFDPILMLDSFDSTNSEDYRAGFPMHPHRGIETISYLSSGQMMHRDSLGHSDTIGSGEVQWMTAGSGILHEERLPESEQMLGVQLWLNLPAKEKMTEPRYYSIKREMIEEIPFAGGRLRLLAGRYGEHAGFRGEHLPLDYYDIHLDADGEWRHETNPERSIMLFTLRGEVMVGDEKISEKTAVKLSSGDGVTLRGTGKPAQVLWMSSSALKEPVAWGGPVVMNSRRELDEAWRDLENGTFVR